MKKTLAIALTLAMVVACLSALFVSAEDAEPITVDFTQGPNNSTVDSSVTPFPVGDEDMELLSADANIRWAYVMAIGADGKIVRVGQNLLRDTDQGAADHPTRGITIPAGGYGIVFHCGDGESTNSHGDLKEYFSALLKAVGVEDTSNVVTEVADAGWYAEVSLEGGEFDLGYAVFYQGAIPGADEPSDDEPADPSEDDSSDDASEATSSEETSKEPVFEEVPEEITVDGDLSDNGWESVEWNSHALWQYGKDGDPMTEGLEAAYAVRADEDNIYIAVKVNEPVAFKEALDAAYKDDVAKFSQTGATDFRIWLKGDQAEDRTFFDVLWNGESFDTFLAKVDNTEDITVAANTEGDSIEIEIQISKAAVSIEESFGIMVTYSSPFCGDADAPAYNAYHMVGVEELPEGWSGKYDFYDQYTIEEIRLGTVLVEVPDDEPGDEPGDEPDDEPEDTYDADIAAKVGDLLTDPDFEVNLEATVEKNEEGKLIMSVVLTVANIKEGVNMQSLTTTLFYDTDRLTLLNGEVEDENDGSITLDCVTKMPVSWESLTKLTKEGEVGVRFIGVNPNKILSEEDPLILTFNFELKEGFTKAGVWVTTAGTTSIYAPNDGSSNTFNYAGNGFAVVGEYVDEDDTSSEETSSEEPSESSVETSSEESSEAPVSSEETTSSAPITGEKGILVFAVLGILAIAGAAAVIKVRN